MTLLAKDVNFKPLHNRSFEAFISNRLEEYVDLVIEALGYGQFHKSKFTWQISTWEETILLINTIVDPVIGNRYYAYIVGVDISSGIVVTFDRTDKQLDFVCRQLTVFNKNNPPTQELLKEATPLSDLEIDRIIKDWNKKKLK